MPVYKKNDAAAARARMAKRAKRQRFIKENKQRILLGVFGFVALVMLAVFTPFGPEYYYNGIEVRKMETSTSVREGVIHDLYKLARFYHITMRKDEAQKLYNEIGKLAFGVDLTRYASNTAQGFEERRQAELRIRRGESYGPPFSIAKSDWKYVGMAIWQTGDLLSRSGRRQFMYNIYKDLYLEDLLEKYPYDLDPEVTKLVQAAADKFIGRR